MSRVVANWGTRSERDAERSPIVLSEETGKERVRGRSRPPKEVRRTLIFESMIRRSEGLGNRQEGLRASSRPVAGDSFNLVMMSFLVGIMLWTVFRERLKIFGTVLDV